MHIEEVIEFAVWRDQEDRERAYRRRWPSVSRFRQEPAPVRKTYSERIAEAARLPLERYVRELADVRSRLTGTGIRQGFKRLGHVQFG